MEFKKNPPILELIEEATSVGQEKGLDSMAKLHEAVRARDPEASERMLDLLNQFNIYLVVNMVREPKENQVANIIQSVAKNYLGIDIEVLGSVASDHVLAMHINNLSAYLKSEKESTSRYHYYEMAMKVMKITSVSNGEMANSSPESEWQIRPLQVEQPPPALG